MARRGDGDAALLLLLHPVHRRAVVDFADLMRLAGVVEDALGRRRLTGVDVGHDADVAVVARWGFTTMESLEPFGSRERYQR